MPVPPPHSSARQQLDQVAVSPSLQQTGQTDRRPDDVTAGWLVDPYAPDAIVHDRLEQPFKPCAPRHHVSRSRNQYRDQLVECAMDGTAKGARRGVDIRQSWP